MPRVPRYSHNYLNPSGFHVQSYIVLYWNQICICKQEGLWKIRLSFWKLDWLDLCTIVCSFVNSPSLAFPVSTPRLPFEIPAHTPAWLELKFEPSSHVCPTQCVSILYRHVGYSLEILHLIDKFTIIFSTAKVEISSNFRLVTRLLGDLADWPRLQQEADQQPPTGHQLWTVIRIQQYMLASSFNSTTIRK